MTKYLLFKPKFDDNPGPVLGLVRISGRVKGKDKRQILDDSFLDTFKINLGISISPIYDPDVKKFFILMVKCIIDKHANAPFFVFDNDIVLSVFLLWFSREQHLQVKSGGASNQPLLL